MLTMTMLLAMTGLFLNGNIAATFLNNLINYKTIKNYMSLGATNLLSGGWCAANLTWLGLTNLYWTLMNLDAYRWTTIGVTAASLGVGIGTFDRVLKQTTPRAQNSGMSGATFSKLSCGMICFSTCNPSAPPSG